MRKYKYFSLIIIFIIALLGAVTFPFLEHSKYDGDLTRMAMLPEKYFGWTAPQPKIQKKLLISSSWAEADILVIGDSFSENLIWQSKLVEADYKVRTESWAAIGQICDDFDAWLSSNKFKGRYVIIQSVENSLDARLKKSIQCNKTRYRFLKHKEVQSPPELIDRVANSDGQGQLYAGIRTWFNQRVYEKKSQEKHFVAWNINENVRLERVKGGCKLFSHIKCEDVLFYRKLHTPVVDEILRNITVINSRIASRELIWLIIPDKSSIYLSGKGSLRDWQAELKQSINVLDSLLRAVDKKEIDVYFGNDTHLSPKGYGLVGDATLDYLKRH